MENSIITVSHSAYLNSDCTSNVIVFCLPLNKSSEKTVAKSKRKPGRSKKVLSEEFEIEEDESTYETNISNQNVAPKHSKKRGKRKKEPKKSSDGEINFNSEEYHKKQHSL